MIVTEIKRERRCLKQVGATDYNLNAVSLRGNIKPITEHEILKSTDLP